MSLAQFTPSNATPDFEPCRVHWKGSPADFYCKVLSSREHRQVTDYFTKEGSLDLSKYREKTDAFISACVYIPASEAHGDKPVIDFVDADGDEHRLVQWLSPREAGALPAALADKVKREVERVNSLKGGASDDTSEDALGNS